MVINHSDLAVRWRGTGTPMLLGLLILFSHAPPQTRQTPCRALQEGNQQLSGSSPWPLTQVPFAAMAARSPSVEVETAGHHPLRYNSSREEMKHPKSASQPVQL